MNLELDNLFAFNDFKINFSYPKKIVNSSIPDEFLIDKPNFRYKKVNILMGANASGKTSIGKALVVIFNSIEKNDVQRVRELVKNKTEKARFSIDFLINSNALFRVNCTILPTEDDYKGEDILLDVYSSKISVKDSYESCVKKLKPHMYDENSEISLSEKLRMIPRLGWIFTFPEPEAVTYTDCMDTNILKNVLMTLDTAIEDVEKSKEVDESYVIRSKNGDVFIQEGSIVKNDLLSSGTRMGIDIAYILSSMCKDQHGFYFCDEKFSFIQTDVEQAILSLMISFLKPNTQLFFTSHNLDLLDLNLPLHSFMFLKKKDNIEIEYPEKIIKKNDVSLKNAVKNDIFNIAPDIDKILSLEDYCTDEGK